jgi:hypothetical protein
MATNNEYYEYLLREGISVYEPVPVTEKVHHYLLAVSQEDNVVRRLYQVTRYKAAMMQNPLACFMENHVDLKYIVGLYDADPEYFVKLLHLQVPFAPIFYACSTGTTYRNTKIKLAQFFAEKDPFFLSRGGGLSKLAYDYRKWPGLASLYSLKALFLLYPQQFSNSMIPSLLSCPRFDQKDVFFFLNELIGACTIVQCIGEFVTQNNPSYLELKVYLRWSKEHWESTENTPSYRVRVHQLLDHYRLDVCRSTSVGIIVSFSIADSSDQPLLVKALKHTRLPLVKLMQLVIRDDSDHTPGFYASRPLQESILWSLNHCNLRYLLILSNKMIGGEILDALKDNTKLGGLEVRPHGQHRLNDQQFQTTRLELLNKALDLMCHNTTLHDCLPWGRIHDGEQEFSNDQTKMTRIYFLGKMNKICCREQLPSTNPNIFFNTLEAAIAMCDRDDKEKELDILYCQRRRLNILYCLLQENPIVWAAGALLASERSNPTHKRKRANVDL